MLVTTAVLLCAGLTFPRTQGELSRTSVSSSRTIDLNTEADRNYLPSCRINWNLSQLYGHAIT